MSARSRGGWVTCIRCADGAPFANSGPPVVKEDVRTEHAGAFGRSGPYLYDRADVLRDLQRLRGSGEVLMRLAISNIAWKPAGAGGRIRHPRRSGCARAGNRPERKPLPMKPTLLIPRRRLLQQFRAGDRAPIVSSSSRCNRCCSV